MSSAVAKEEQEATTSVAKPSRLRKPLMIGAPLLLLALAGGAWKSGILLHHAGADAKATSGKSVEAPTLVDVPDIVTNLDNGTHRAVFVKLKARIEVAHATDVAAISANMPRILDAFQTYLRSSRPEELHGGEGTYRLREALMNRIDVIAGPVRVLDVLFIELLIQ